MARNLQNYIILCFLVITQISFGQPTNNYEAIGDSLVQSGNAEALIAYFENELKVHPNDESILRWLGFGHLALNHLDQAELFYLQALQVNPACARCYKNIGWVYAYKGDTKLALQNLDKAIALDSKDALIIADRGRILEMTGDEFGALRDYDKAIQLDPQNAELYNMRGEYNVRFNYASLALNDFTKAIQLNPQFLLAYFNRASVYYMLNRFSEALTDMNIAISVDSTNYSGYSGRGTVLEMMGEKQKALDDYNTAISLNPDDPYNYLNRARLFYQMEDLDASCTDYTKLKLDVDMGLITDQSIIDEITGAIPDFCDSTRASYYYQRGVAYYNLEQYQKAVDIYQLGLTYFPNNAISQSFLGNAYMALNQYQLALEYYNLSLENITSIRQEVELNPRFKQATREEIDVFYNGTLASTYASMAECLINLGQLDEALLKINAAIENAPQVDEIGVQAFYNTRGYIYLLKGNYNPAIADFDKTISLDPTFSLAYVNRAVAKVSLAEQVKIKSFSLSTNIHTQPIQLSWDTPSKSSIKNSEIKLLSALADCNTAIELDAKLGYGYYIRGQIKLMLQYEDNCIDLYMAKDLGMIVAQELFKSCD